MFGPDAYKRLQASDLWLSKVDELHCDIYCLTKHRHASRVEAAQMN